MKKCYLSILSVVVLVFMARGEVFADGPMFIAAMSFGVGDHPYSVAISDLNGDGNSDLAVANWVSDTISVLLGTGDGTFQTKIDYGVGHYPLSVAISDLNGDGNPDLTVANYSSDTISVLLGTGDGTFQNAVDYGAGDDPYSVAISDLNGDGNPDIAVVNALCGTISVLLGTGDGTLQTAVDYGVGNYPLSIAISDLNGDGKPDLAVANALSGTISVLLGTGDGTFQVAVDYGAGGYPQSVAISDLDGDGNPDLALADSGDTIWVLLGTGDGTFQTAVGYGAGDAPFSVAISDLNGDGNPDLAVANEDSDTISVLLGTGDGTFQAAVDYGAGANPNSVAISDLNGDGKPDLAVANEDSDTVSILLNISTPSSTHLLSITKTGTGSGAVTSTPLGINCGADCSGDFAENIPVTLSTSAESGSAFTGWSGSGCSGTWNCTLTMDSAKSVIAEFTDMADDTDSDNIPDYIEKTSCSAFDDNDTDNDGILDGDEDTNHNGSLDTGETSPCTSDTDIDGLTDPDELLLGTDPADADSDNDNMPDGWEVQYNFDPFQDDADKDYDDDGRTNLEEYNASSDPTSAPDNHAPNQPVLSQPGNDSIDMTLTPELETNAFSDPDNEDVHIQTEWEISTLNDFSSVVFNVKSSAHLTSLTVPDLALVEGESYFWRVRFFDNHQFASDWSEVFSFTTLTTNRDIIAPAGIPDDQQVADTIDLNKDGIYDNDQPDVIKSVNTAVGDGQMGVAPDPLTNAAIEFIEAISPDTISTHSRPNEMPLGLIAFKLAVTQGATIEATVYFSEAAPADAKWYWYNSVDGWVDYSDHATFSMDRLSVFLELKDGGYGDADGIANGFIVDPGGYGTASWVKGKVTDASTGQEIFNAVITIQDAGGTVQISDLEGDYLCMVIPGTYTITVSAEGYEKNTYSNVVVPEGGILIQDVELTPLDPSDVDPPDTSPHQAPDNGDDNGKKDSENEDSGGGCFIRALM